MDSCLDIKRVSPVAYRVFFPDSQENFRLDLLNDENAMADQLERLEHGAGDSYRRFLSMARGHLELGVPYFIDRDFTELTDAKGLLDLLPQLSSINPWQLLGPHDLVMRSFFKDPRLRAAFTFQDLYVGLTPASAPAVFSLLAGTELTAGIHYPIGGFGAVRDALRSSIEHCGVDIRTGTTVEGINVVGNAAVDSVTLDTGERIDCDVVVCNVDLPAAYSLIKTCEQSSPPRTGKYVEKRLHDMSRLKYSSGVVGYNWCVTRQLPELCHHNVFLSTDFEKAWRPSRTVEELPHHPNFYLHAPSKTDSSAAPPGAESVMVLLPVANMQGGKRDYSTLIDAGREKVLESLRVSGVGDIGPFISRELVISPPEWEQRYGMQYGAAFGLSHGLDQLSLFRPANKDAEIGGLYFVGASTRPGNGVPLCFISAKLTAERVLKDMGKGT